MFNPSVLIHTTLDVLGCLPGGSIFDLANAAIYFLEDNEEEGWKSLIFAIPGMDLAGKGIKYGAKIGGKTGKALETTFKTIDLAGHLGSTFLSASDFGNGMAFMIDKYMVGEAEWSSKTAWELVSLAGHGFQLKSFSGSFMNNVNAGTYDSVIPGMSTAEVDLNKWFGEGSTFHYAMHDNRGCLDLDALFGTRKNNSKKIPTELQKALNELDASGLRPGQTELHMSQLNKTLDQIQNNYIPTKAYSSVYSDGMNRYLVEGHHTTVAFKMLGKENAINMNIKTLDMPSATNVYWSKKWYEFWKKTIKIVED